MNICNLTFLAIHVISFCFFFSRKPCILIYLWLSLSKPQDNFLLAYVSLFLLMMLWAVNLGKVALFSSYYNKGKLIIRSKRAIKSKIDMVYLISFTCKELIIRVVSLKWKDEISWKIIKFYARIIKKLLYSIKFL